jgi:hypothetical protein
MKIVIDTKEVMEGVEFLLNLLSEDEVAYLVSTYCPHNETKTAKKQPKAVEPKQEVVQEEKTLKIDLQTVSSLAKDMAQNHGAEKIRTMIQKYGKKLAEIDESDYEALYNDLKEL